MVILDKKKILKVVLLIFLIVFVFAFSLNKSEDNDYIETVALPVSGKVVVVDAGHGVPDEGAFLLHKENKQLTFYK